MSNDMRNKWKLNELTAGSFLFAWPVASDGYRWRGDVSLLSPAYEGVSWLVPEGAGWRSYCPLSKPALHREFADLPLDSEAFRRFACTYGLLGRITLPLEVHGGSGFVHGESFLGWQSAVVEMAITLAVWDLVKEERAGKLGQFIKWDERGEPFLHCEGRWQSGSRGVTLNLSPIMADYPELVSKAGDGAVVRGFGGHIDRPLGFDAAEGNTWENGDVIGPATYFVCKNVNDAIEGRVSPTVLPFGKRELFLRPTDLLTALWVMVLREVTEMASSALCGSCGKWYPTFDKRQRFCSVACKQKDYRDRKKGKYAISGGD